MVSQVSVPPISIPFHHSSHSPMPDPSLVSPLCPTSPSNLILASHSPSNSYSITNLPNPPLQSSGTSSSNSLKSSNTTNPTQPILPVSNTSTSVQPSFNDNHFLSRPPRPPRKPPLLPTPKFFLPNPPHHPFLFHPPPSSSHYSRPSLPPITHNPHFPLPRPPHPSYHHPPLLPTIPSATQLPPQFPPQLLPHIPLVHNLICLLTNLLSTPPPFVPPSH